MSLLPLVQTAAQPPELQRMPHQRMPGCICCVLQTAWNTWLPAPSAVTSVAALAAGAQEPKVCTHRWEMPGQAPTMVGTMSTPPPTPTRLPNSPAAAPTRGAMRRALPRAAAGSRGPLCSRCAASAAGCRSFGALCAAASPGLAPLLVLLLLLLAALWWHDLAPLICTSGCHPCELDVCTECCRLPADWLECKAAVAADLCLLLLAELQVWAAAHADRIGACICCRTGAARLAAKKWLHAGVNNALHDAAAAHGLPGPPMADPPACGMACVHMLAAVDLSRLAARMLSSWCQRQSCRLRSISFHMPVGKTHCQIHGTFQCQACHAREDRVWLMIRERTLLLKARQLLLVRTLKSQQVEWYFSYLSAFKKVLVRLDSACCRTSSPLAA